jgi:hypothetical protein
MSVIYLASMLLAAQPEAMARYPLAAPPPVIMPAKPLSAVELRKAHESAIRQSYRTNLMEGVPELVKVYRLLEQDTALNAAERSELRFKTRSRLLAVGDDIVSDARRQRARQRQAELAAKRGVREPLVAPPPATGQPSDYAATATATTAAQQGRAGGLGEDEGEALVDLIRNTIKPESWDIAGGPGRIVYYRQWQALVVHQTEEVHWLIGGLRGALGR